VRQRRNYLLGGDENPVKGIVDGVPVGGGLWLRSLRRSHAAREGMDEQVRAYRARPLLLMLGGRRLWLRMVVDGLRSGRHISAECDGTAIMPSLGSAVAAPLRKEQGFSWPAVERSNGRGEAVVGALVARLVALSLVCHIRGSTTPTSGEAQKRHSLRPTIAVRLFFFTHTHKLRPRCRALPNPLTAAIG